MDDEKAILLTHIRVTPDVEAGVFSVTLSVPVLSDAAGATSLAGGSILVGEHRYDYTCEYHELETADDNEQSEKAQSPAAEEDGPYLIGHQWLDFALPVKDVENAIGEHVVQLELQNSEGECEAYGFSYQRKNRAKRRLQELTNADIRAILIAESTGLTLFVDYTEEILEKRSRATGERRKNFYPTVNDFSFSRPLYSINQAGGYFELRSTLYAHTAWNVSLDELVIEVGDFSYTPIVQASYPLNERRYNHECKLILRIPFEDEFSMAIHNAVRAVFVISEEDKISKGIQYSKYLKKYIAARSPFHKNEEQGIVAFFRQNVSKNTTFTVRHANVTDGAGANAKLTLAWALSKVCFWINPVLVFEKNGMHYEESGRAVYESLIRSGRKDAYFVLAQSVQDTLEDVDARYRQKMIAQHSFKHYLYFFRCRRFLGSEALAHCLELRCPNIFVQRKVKAKNQKYVFLQHGVMYMVSLDSPQRSSFRKRNMKGESYIVVSSKKEAAHFTEYAGFTDDDLIVCGLPKFDSSYLNPGADKILIMPTWRIWEFNQARLDFSETKYFKMVRRIYDAIPEQLKGKVVIANHPLFNTATFSAEDGSDSNVSAVQEPEDGMMAHYAPDGVSYDELLRDVSLLITDYSSIAYDAYYRGANVVFYWEEKDECMEAYGEGTHLMIDEDTAFGPVCYSSESLPKAVSDLYGKPQPDLYLGRYREIVEHHDGKNTERLLAMLAERGFFK